MALLTRDEALPREAQPAIYYDTFDYLWFKVRRREGEGAGHTILTYLAIF